MIIIGLNAPFCLDIVLSLILSGLNVPLCLVEKLHINPPAKKSRVDQGPVKVRWLTYCKNTNTKCQSCHGTINTNEVTVVLQMKDRKRISDRNGTDRIISTSNTVHLTVASEIQSWLRNTLRRGEGEPGWCKTSGPRHKSITRNCRLKSGPVSPLSFMVKTNINKWS